MYSLPNPKPLIFTVQVRGVTSHHRLTAQKPNAGTVNEGHLNKKSTSVSLGFRGSAHRVSSMASRLLGLGRRLEMGLGFLGFRV